MIGTKVEIDLGDVLFSYLDAAGKLNVGEKDYPFRKRNNLGCYRRNVVPSVSPTSNKSECDTRDAAIYCNTDSCRTTR